MKMAPRRPPGRASVMFKQEIERHFGSDVFQRPLFYSYPGGLRFGLCEPGNTLEQFLSALHKATTICRDIFADHSFVVCLRTHSSTCHFEHRRKLECLKSIGISVPAQRSIWCEAIDPEEWLYETAPEYWVYLSFEGKRSMNPTFKALI
ncbi:DUF3885 domain-containing protein [Pseudomonas entomophila]|uniref:DUF3885 domain-containing protein n=1 Tax=Pseudomonas entomophila TaxID=312306 RepID=UPI003D2F7B71